MKQFLRLIVLALVASATLVHAQTINLRLGEVISSPERTEFLKELLAEFEAEHPNIKVEVITVPWGQSFQKLLTMVQAGQAPDVVELPARWLALYANAGWLEDLSPYVESWEGADELTDRTWQVARAFNDTPYFVPYGFGLRALYYNTKLFEQAGIDGPPETVEEFQEAARKITELGPNRYGYCLRGGSGSFDSVMMFMAAHMGSAQWFDENGESTFDSPGAIEGIQFMIDLYQNGHAPRDSIGWGFNEVVSGFYSGTCGMLDQDPDTLNPVSEHMNPDDYDIAPMPVGPHGKAYPKLGVAGWAVLSETDHPDAAWELVSFLASADVSTRWGKQIGRLPTAKAAQDDEFYDRYSAWLRQLNEPEYVLDLYPFYLPQLGVFFDDIAVQTYQNALLGDRTAEDVANQWAEFLTNAYQEWQAEQEQRGQ